MKEAYSRGTGATPHDAPSQVCNAYTSVQHLHNPSISQPSTPHVQHPAKPSTAPCQAAEKKVSNETGELVIGKTCYPGKPETPTGTWAK